MVNKSLLAAVSWLLGAALALSLLLTVGCGATDKKGQAEETQKQEVISKEETQGQKVISEEEAQKIAADFVRHGPTFKFDGIDQTLKLTQSQGEETTNRWEFHYEFQSRQAGYGDRSGMMLAQVITDHKAQIVVEQGKVVQAVLDGRWDELRQRMIE